jgi:MFS family permease
VALVGAESRFSRREILVSMSGLVTAMLLAQLDNMIVAPALPTIVGDLGGLAHMSWLTTGYILATAVATPVWGKLGDLYGRRITFVASVALFLAGSALCGLAQTMTELVGFRALQGLGAGGLIVGALSIIGEMTPPRDRAKYQGVIAAVMPVALIGGPLIGGAITDHLSWRWAFYVNLPLGVVTLVIAWFTLAKLPRGSGHARIDWFGTALLTVWITALTLTTSWGGTEYAWTWPDWPPLSGWNGGAPNRSCRCGSSRTATSTWPVCSPSSPGSPCSAPSAFCRSINSSYKVRTRPAAAYC